LTGWLLTWKSEGIQRGSGKHQTIKEKPVQGVDHRN